jgi:hypothetical protein
MKILFMVIVSFLLIGVLSFTGLSRLDDSTKQQMFCMASKNVTKEPFYVVINVKNIKTGQIKEICTAVPFINGAINKENGILFIGIDCKEYPNRYFEFSKDSALSNIEFNLYTQTDLNNYVKKINLKKTIADIRDGSLKGKRFTGNHKEDIMFIHILFNNGVLAQRVGDIVSTLQFRYIRRK